MILMNKGRDHRYEQHQGTDISVFELPPEYRDNSPRFYAVENSRRADCSTAIARKWVYATDLLVYAIGLKLVYAAAARAREAL